MRKTSKKKKITKIEARCIENAHIILDTNGTVRSVAKEVGMSKSSVYADVTYRLQKIDKRLCNKVRKLIDKNKAERAIRGGQATKAHFEEIRKSKVGA